VSRLRADYIKKFVANYFKITIEEIDGPRREKGILLARWAAIYLCSRNTLLSLGQIGAAFGHRDHTTIIHTLKKCTAEINDNVAYSKLIEQLQLQLVTLLSEEMEISVEATSDLIAQRLISRLHANNQSVTISQTPTIEVKQIPVPVANPIVTAAKAVCRTSLEFESAIHSKSENITRAALLSRVQELRQKMKDANL